MELIILIFKNVWIIFIIAMVINAFYLKGRVKKYISENPDLEKGYNDAFWAQTIIGNIPFIIIAMGCISGSMNNVFDVFRPRTLNPFVLAFHASIIVIYALSIWWIYFNNGAAFIERHPGLIQKRTFISESTNVTAREVKLFFPVMLLGGIAGMVMMWVIDIPAIKF